MTVYNEWNKLITKLNRFMPAKLCMLCSQQNDHLVPVVDQPDRALGHIRENKHSLSLSLVYIPSVLHWAYTPIMLISQAVGG